MSERGEEQEDASAQKVVSFSGGRYAALLCSSIPLFLLYLTMPPILKFIMAFLLKTLRQTCEMQLIIA